MTVLLLTFVVSVVSALVPLVNAEAYLVALASTTDLSSIWLVSAVAGVGQTVGKVAWYEAGRRALDWPWVRRKLGTPRAEQRRELWQRRLSARPWASSTVLFASATAGFPPLLVMAVVAGQLHMSRSLFTLIVLVGRTLRFAAVLGGLWWVTDLIARAG